MNLFAQLANRFSKVEPLPPGTHHMQSLEDEKPFRVHLRLHPDGSGMLILNATTVLQLNPTAAEYAYHFIKGTSADETAKQVARRYRVHRSTALEDFTSFTEKIRTLISTPDLDPVSYLDMERAQPHSAELAAPLRLDCAITYRLPQGTHVDYAPVKRVERELATDEWKKILDKAWHAGIPHIVFTGGEATLRTDLVELIAHAEKNGQVCGLLTDGLKLADARYLQALLESGLDHVMLILQPEDPRSWEAIETILPQDLFLTVHLTLDRRNSKEAEGFLQRLAEMSVANISLSTSDPDLLDELLELQGFASTLHLTMRWDLPVPYSSANPVTIETREEQMQEGKGRMWMYVEPDGDVLPAQGQSERVLGNLLRDDWSVIQPP